MHGIFVWMSSGQTVKHAHDVIPATGQVESLTQRLTCKMKGFARVWVQQQQSYWALVFSCGAKLTVSFLVGRKGCLTSWALRDTKYPKKGCRDIGYDMMHVLHQILT